MPTDTQQPGPADAAAALKPGQKLLTTLQQTSVGRLDRYKKTTAGLQSKAKQSIPAGPKPPGRNDLGNCPVEEVHQLQADVPRVQGNMQGILAMLQSKADRHAAALAKFQEAKQEAELCHNSTAAAAAADSKAKLAAISSSIEQDMAVLAEDRVMVLTEQQLQEVWHSVEQQRGPIIACIDALAAGLQRAEQAFSQQVQAALQDMVAVMCDIAHLDEGRIQRLTEQESAALNLQLLENRRATSEVLRQLHANQVLQEQACFKQWQAACEAWRTLRSRHAVATFCQHIQQDLAEPPQRLQLFAELRDSQQDAHAQLLKLCQQLHQLGPPHLSSQSVGGWVAEAKTWDGSWQQRLSKYLTDLQQQEADVEAQVQEELGVLRSEVLGYKGLSDSQVDELLAQEAQPVLQDRRAAAQALLQCADTFLQRQAAEWQLAVQVLSSWLSSLVALYESHKSSTAAAETGIKAALRSAVQQFESEDAAREAALATAVELLSQGSDEKELDACLEAALQALSAVQAGYRTHHTSAVSTVRAYPGQVKNSSDMYIRCLSGLLHVQQHQQQQQQQQEAPKSAGEQHATGASAAGSIAGAAAQAAPATAGAGDEQSDSPHVHGQVQVPTGGWYDQLHDLWQGLMDATPKPWLAQFSHMQDSSGPGHLAPAQAAVAAAAASAAASQAPAAPAASLSVSSSGGKNGAPAKPTKQQLAEAAAAEEAARAAEAAAAAAAEEAAAYAAAAAQPPSPMSSSTGALCLRLLTPDEIVSDGLLQLQTLLLLEAESFGGRVQGGAESWAEQMETLLTEELDGRLRAHRPRAGRIEEEVRVVRSAELVAQRRRVDSHLKAQEKAVQQQQTQFDAAVLDLRADAADWRAKLLDYERLLGSALSSKGIDICWREAQALRVKLGRQLDQRMQQLQQLVLETCSSLDATSTDFEAEHLKAFADGGRYAEPSLVTHRANLAALHTYVSQQQSQQQAKLAELRTELTGSISDAQDKIEALLPSYKQDMALVEVLAQKVDGARRKATAALSSNTQAADSISTLLEELRGCLVKAPAAGGQGQQAGRAAGFGGGAPRTECQQLLESVNKLRQQVHRQSQVLDLLQSTSIPSRQLTLAIPAELQPLSAQQGTEAPVPLPTSRAMTPQPGKGSSQPGAKPAGKGASAKVSSAATGTKAAHNAGAAAAAAALAAAGGVGGPAAADAPAVPLAKHISSIIDASKHEVEVVAKAYYAAKDAGRPIRYPASIAPTLQELLSGVDGVMAGLRQMLQEHMATGAKRLRVQVVEAYRLLQRVPAAAMSLLVQHLLQLSADQRQQVRSGFASQRQQLERQLEQHKHSLHPSMLNIARRSELDALKAAEAARQQAAATLTTDCASACLSLTHSHAQQLATAAADLSRMLLLLLDGCVLPADLVPAAEGDDALASLQRLTLEELSRLAAAQDAAQPVGPAAAPSQPSKPAAASKPRKQGASSGDAAASASAAAAAGVSASGRPFEFVSWQLENSSMSVEKLGWTQADQAALVTFGQPAPTAPAPPPTAAAAAAPGQPKAAAGGAGRPGTASAQTAMGSTKPGTAQGTPAASSAEPVLVTGVDTVCHRAVVLAHRAAVHQVQANLSQESVAALKQDLYMWTTQEQQWARAWEAMLQDMDHV